MSNVMEVQKQIKENATEVNDFLMDLDSWAAEMKVKDNQLREQKLNKSTSLPGKENSSPIEIPVNKEAVVTTETKNIPIKHKQIQQAQSVTTKKKKEKKKVCDSGGGDPGLSIIDQVPSPPKKEKIKAYEYDKWDKFDVEEECTKLDAEDESESSGSDIDEEMENIRLKQQAVAERERGNTFFKQGKYDKAIERYTAGIQIDPYCPLLPANRAMAFLKVKKFGAAEQDCSLSLSLDPTYIKALQRRMAARSGLQKYHEALMDCNKILQLDPTNKQAQSEKVDLESKISDSKITGVVVDDTLKQEEAVKKEVSEKIQKLNLKDNMKTMFKPVREVEMLEPSSDVSPGLLIQPLEGDSESGHKKVGIEEMMAPWTAPDPDLVINPVQKQPHQRSKKAMKSIRIQDHEQKSSITGTAQPIKEKSRSFRMPIIEVDGDTSIDDSLSPMVTEDNSFHIKPSQDLPVQIPEDERFVELPDDTKDIKDVTFGSQEKTCSKITEINNDSENKMEIDEEPADALDSEEVPSDGFLSKSRGFCRKVEKEMIAELEEGREVSAVSSEQVPGPPKTSAQFNKDWRKLKSTESRLEYISQLSFESYAAVFKSQMESKIFSEIIQVLKDGNPSPQILSVILLGLSSLPRISALSMFLASSELSILTKLLDTASDNLNSQQINTIKKAMSI